MSRPIVILDFDPSDVIRLPAGDTVDVGHPDVIYVVRYGPHGAAESVTVISVADADVQIMASRA